MSELAEELSVSKKTIRRDLETFQAVGFPLEETVAERGCKRWRIAADTAQPALAFAFDEAIALYLGWRLLDPLAGTLLWDAAQRAFGKLRALLTPGGMKYVERFSEIFHLTLVGTSDYSRKGELIDQLLMAMEDRRITHITYQSLQATEPSTYDVYPLGMTHHRGALYLVGWAPRRERVQHWKMDRIEDVEVTGLQFQRPEGFDLRKHLARSFGIFHGEEDAHVKVRFSPTVARYVQEGRWHPSQKLTKQKDGSLLAEFHLNSTEEIKRWLLSFGKHAVVLAPENLRQEIGDELQSALDQYRPGPRPARETRNRMPHKDPSHES